MEHPAPDWRACRRVQEQVRPCLEGHADSASLAGHADSAALQGRLSAGVGALDTPIGAMQPRSD
jgi:hypothetical protein